MYLDGICAPPRHEEDISAITRRLSNLRLREVHVISSPAPATGFESLRCICYRRHAQFEAAR